MTWDSPEDARDKFRDECGVFGIFGHADAANLTYLGLYAMQHRGQESAGIVTWTGNRVAVEKGMGYVADVFNEGRLARLPGSRFQGHLRLLPRRDPRQMLLL